MTITTLGVPSVPRQIDGAASPHAPATGPLVDGYGRIATDLRVSLTDRCNLRCTYCMPAAGLPWLGTEQLLRPDEIVRLLRIGVTRLGITKVRFTGGEPLLAKHLADVVAFTAALQPRPEIALTTNGVLLAEHAAWPGKGRVGSGERLPGQHRGGEFRGDHPPPPASRRALRLGGRPYGGSAAGEGECRAGPGHRPGRRRSTGAVLPSTTTFSCAIIEQMPLDAGHEWRRAKAVTASQVLAQLRRHLFTLEPDPGARGASPAELWRITDTATGATGTVGLIASVSHPFCSTCDRVRLTADGQLRSCLFASEETDLRGLLRREADDAAIEAAWRAAMWDKPAGHGINDPDFVQPSRPMSAIGG